MDRGGISGDSIDLSSANGVLCAVKGVKKVNELHDGLTRHCGKFPITMNTVLHRVELIWQHPRRLIEVVF
jgi:hypothetical protein